MINKLYKIKMAVIHTDLLIPDKLNWALNDMYMLSYLIIYIRYIYDHSLLLALLQLGLLHFLKLVKTLWWDENKFVAHLEEESGGSRERVEEVEEVVDLLVVKCLRAVQITYVIAAMYMVFLRYFYPVPSIRGGFLVPVLFIGEFVGRGGDSLTDAEQELDKLYDYKLFVLLYILDVILFLIVLTISSVVFSRDSVDDKPTSNHILLTFQNNVRNRYGILSLLGTNLFLAPTPENNTFPPHYGSIP